MISVEQKAKIRWHCRRGMLELDLLFKKFIDNHLDSLNLKQFRSLEKLLALEDPMLYDWLMNDNVAIKKEFLEIVQFIKLSN